MWWHVAVYILAVVGGLTIILVVGGLLVGHLFLHDFEQMDDSDDLLVVEHVEERYSFGERLQATEQIHRDLLAAGDAVLAKLSDPVRQSLGAPISDQLKAWFSAGDTPERLTPERVRAARAVIEVAAVLENLMRVLSSRHTDTFWFFLDDHRPGLINMADGQILVRHVISKIADKIEMGDYWHNAEYYEPEFMPYVAASDIWKAIVAVLREGKTRVPGLRAKPPVDWQKIWDTKL